jgi:hypothetical protein
MQNVSREITAILSKIEEDGRDGLGHTVKDARVMGC